MDSQVNVAKLQGEVATLLGIKQDHLIFSYKQKENIIKLDLITINPQHDQSFLFHSIKAINKEEALMKMKEYIEIHYSSEDSFTLQWIKVGEQKLHTSYFRAQNMYEVLDKFYYERDLSSYRIFNISLNPIS